MKKPAIILFTFVAQTLLGHSENVHLDAVHSVHIAEEMTVPLTLEYAVSTNERTWGLMQRKELPTNQGMLFLYPQPAQLSLWMFNCFLDLSVAFCDHDHVIRSIKFLKAYPEKMDPKRPVNSLEDFANYSQNDAIIQFYHQHAVKSPFSTKFALEMNANWFNENNVQNGDVLRWSLTSPQAYITRSLNIEPYLRDNEDLILLTFSDSKRQSVWSPDQREPCDLAYLNESGKVIATEQFTKQKRHFSPVFISQKPVKHLLIAPLNSLKKWGIYKGITIDFPQS